MNVASAVVLSILLLAAAAPAAFAVTLSGNQDEYNPGDQLIVTGTAGPVSYTHLTLPTKA